MNMREAIKQITGQEPSPEQIQRIMSIAHTLDIPSGDPMLAIMAIMDAYYGSIATVPKAMAEQADKAASVAASKAQQQVNVAVSGLLGTVSDKIAQVAKESISRTQDRADWITLTIEFVIVGLYTSLVASLSFWAGIIAQSDKTKGGWYFPAWMQTKGTIMFAVSGLLNAPAGFVLSFVLALMFVVLLLTKGNESNGKLITYSAGALFSIAAGVATASGII